MFNHSHHFGISSGQRTHAGMNLVTTATAEKSIDQTLEPGEVVTVPIHGKLESLAACASVAGVPDGNCSLMVDAAQDFDLQRGPVQWYRNGHLLPDAFDSVNELALENTSDEPVRVMLLAGFRPFEVTEDEPADE